MELEMNEIPKSVREILEHYGATLPVPGRVDDGGEPDEAPDHEGEVTMPTPEEMERERKEWAAIVASWSKEGGGKK